MNHRATPTGQRINSREMDDNSPPRYSAPSAHFKAVLASYANPHCPRCGGTGYIGVFKHVCAGRCFKCIPEDVWEHAQEEFHQDRETGKRNELVEIYDAVCGPDGEDAYLSDGMWITPDGHIYDRDCR